MTSLFTHISNVRIFVDDHAQSVRFYRDTLGLPLRTEGPGFAIFDTGAVSLMLEPGETAGEDDGDLVGRFSGVSLATPDIDRTYAVLSERGVEFLHAPSTQPWGKMTHFKDPSGNVLTMVQYV